MYHSLYPAFIRLKYTVGLTRQHTMTLPVIAEESGSGFVLTQNDDTNAVLWTFHVDDLVDQFKVNYPNTTNFESAELWTLASPTADPQFREIYDVSVLGTSVGASVPYCQLVQTYRTSAGGLFRQFLLEPAVAVDLVKAPPYTSYGSMANLAAFHVGSTGFVRGRDGGKLVSDIRFVTKTNDKLRKKGLGL